MDVLNSLLPFRAGKQVASLASDLAQRHCAEVEERVSVRLAELSTTELKGYARACATQILAGAVDARLLRSRGLDENAKGEIILLAAEGIAERIVAETARDNQKRRAA